jgi:hypothetical protein
MNEKRWRNCFVADHGGEALADLKPRMVLGYCSLRKNEFQRANIRGEDDIPVEDEADLKEYKIELERRRQIGLTIDPATAETTFWWSDIFDPYHVLGKKHHAGQTGREQFARNPGGEWVNFDDLPEATREALRERDERKLAFPYGLHPGDDIINRPPVAEHSLFEDYDSNGERQD